MKKLKVEKLNLNTTCCPEHSAELLMLLPGALQ
jgi:hypothetical protein